MIDLTREIRDLYARSAALADEFNGLVGQEHERLKRACRGRESRIPELNYFDNVFDRAAALRRALNDPQIRLRSGLLQGAVWFAILAISWRCLTLAGSLPAAMLLALLLGGAGLLLNQRMVLAGERFRGLLRAELLARGVRICLRCGYDLRGQTVPRCPECGAAEVRPAAIMMGGEHGG